ncbi:uncharacterized protein LOC143283914 [Babylonia areolata]|uniref:uncharacterized protein LOC143283914 n=1 Tax=Babylonia areolata TaxID=304850 RepID=UPI003FD3E524
MQSGSKAEGCHKLGRPAKIGYRPPELGVEVSTPRPGLLPHLLIQTGGSLGEYGMGSGQPGRNHIGMWLPLQSSSDDNHHINTRIKMTWDGWFFTSEGHWEGFLQDLWHFSGD